MSSFANSGLGEPAAFGSFELFGKTHPGRSTRYGRLLLTHRDGILTGRTDHLISAYSTLELAVRRRMVGPEKSLVVSGSRFVAAVFILKPIVTLLPIQVSLDRTGLIDVSVIVDGDLPIIAGRSLSHSLRDRRPLDDSVFIQGRPRSGGSSLKGLGLSGLIDLFRPQLIDSVL